MPLKCDSASHYLIQLRQNTYRSISHMIPNPNRGGNLPSFTFPVQPALLGFFVPYLLLAVIRFPTPPKSIAPLTRWYLTPGQSWLRPPLTKTTLCCCTLCPTQPKSLPPGPRMSALLLQTLSSFSWNKGSSSSSNNNYFPPPPPPPLSSSSSSS